MGSIDYSEHSPKKQMDSEIYFTYLADLTHLMTIEGPSFGISSRLFVHFVNILELTSFHTRNPTKTITEFDRILQRRLPERVKTKIEVHRNRFF